MAHSLVSICNAGLIAIGASPILSLDDGSKSANLCKLRFEACRDAVLRMHPWNCAIRRVELSPLSTSPAFGWANQFQLPSDCLRVLHPSPEDDIDYKLEGSVLLSDESSISLIYIFQLDDTTQFDTLLAEAIGAYLAWQIAYSLTNLDSVVAMAKDNFDIVLRRAKTIDSQEDQVPGVNTPYWDGARVSETIGRSNR